MSDARAGRRRLAAAVIGTGFVGPHHVDAVRRGGLGDVVVIVGRDEDRTRSAAATAAVGRWTTDAASVFADPAIDVVHVCTPNASHEPLALAALAAGKHVVVEKPLALDTAGAARIRDAAARAVRHAMVAFTYRGYPQVRRAREVVASGRLGETRLVHGTYLQDWLLDPATWSWRVDPAQSGGSRAVADIGSHWFDTVEFVTGLRVEAVLADLVTFMPTRYRPAGHVETFGAGGGRGEPVAVETEDAATILVRFEGGARGAVVVSQVSPGRKNDLMVAVDGSVESLAWRQEDPERLRIGAKAGWTILEREPVAVGAGVPTLATGHPEGWGEALRDLLRPFYAAVSEGRDPRAVGADYPTLEAGLRAMAFTDAVLRSSREARWVALDEVR